MADSGDQYKKEGFEGQRAIIIPRKILKEQCLDHPLIQNLFITDIGFYPKARGHFRERPHGCDQHILIYVASGCGHAEIKKESFQINAGEIIDKRSTSICGGDDNIACMVRGAGTALPDGIST